MYPSWQENKIRIGFTKTPAIIDAIVFLFSSGWNQMHVGIFKFSQQLIFHDFIYCFTFCQIKTIMAS